MLSNFDVSLDTLLEKIGELNIRGKDVLPVHSTTTLVSSHLTTSYLKTVNRVKSKRIESNYRITRNLTPKNLKRISFCIASIF